LHGLPCCCAADGNNFLIMKGSRTSTHHKGLGFMGLGFNARNGLVLRIEIKRMHHKQRAAESYICYSSYSFCPLCI
jgi:hypothetical protein